jgi:hypothetical protein
MKKDSRVRWFIDSSAYQINYRYEGIDNTILPYLPFPKGGIIPLYEGD